MKPAKFKLPEDLVLSTRLSNAILGASEYLSREGRCRLSRIIYNAIAAEQVRQGVDRFSPSKQFAQIAGVSTRTIERWVGGDVQSCNVNAESLLRLGLRFDRESTLELLIAEQVHHDELNKDLAKELRSNQK